MADSGALKNNRLQFQRFLEALLGSRNVYFQPPASVKMKYPAIVFSRSKIKNTHANNKVYLQSIAYQVTIIDPDPDSEIVDEISKLSFAQFERHYAADNLNHDVFTVYF